MGYNSVADIRLVAVGSQICEISRIFFIQFNSDIIPTYSRLRSPKVIDFGVNQKCICGFLLVINGNFGRISYHFRDIDV